jgi:hypothetical protein
VFSIDAGPVSYDFRRVTLEKVAIAVSAHIDPRNIMASRLEAREYPVGDMLSYQLTTYLARKKVTEDCSTASEVTHSFFVPLTWWDHAKETLRDFLPARLKGIIRKIDRGEVYLTQETTHRNVYRLCPHLPTDMERDHLEFMISDYR